MNNEFDYEQNRSEHTPGYSQESAGVPETQEGTYRAESRNDGAYRYSGGGVPGGGGNAYGAGGAGAEGNSGTWGNVHGSSYGSGNPGNGAPQNGGYGAQPQYSGATHNPLSGYNVTPRQEKKKSGGKRIVAVAIVCALIGGLGGGAAVGMVMKGGTAAEGESPAAEEMLPDSQIEDAETMQSEETADAFNKTTVDVTTNSQATAMTPQDVYENYVNAVVAISNESTTNVFGQVTETASSGSGFIISKDGYIVTNNHVVSGAEKLTVIMTSGEEHEAKIIGADSENDVALIKIDAADLPTVPIGDSDEIEVGQQVCAIGNPLGELTNTLTVGYVSALDREINENGTPINMFQTDCAINSGNSGGPLFDMHGNVVGITTAKYSSNGYNMSSASIEGIGFCVPISDAMDIVSDLLQYGYVKGRVSMGITCGTVSSTVIQYYNLPDGVVVQEVGAESAAEKAGLQAGDIISEIDDTDISGVTDLKLKLKEYQPGDSAALKVYRSETNETLELEITFDEMISATAATDQQETDEQEKETQEFPVNPFGFPFGN